VDHKLLGEQDIAARKAKILASRVRLPAGLARLGVRSRRSVVRGTNEAGATARAFASRRQKDGTFNRRAQLREVLPPLEAIKGTHCSQTGGKKVSLPNLHDRLGGLRDDREGREAARARLQGPPSRGDAWMHRRSIN